MENPKVHTEIHGSLLFVLSILFICPSRVVVDVKLLEKIYSAFWWCWEKVIVKNGEKLEDPSLLLPGNMFNK